MKPRRLLCVLLSVLLVAIQQFGFAHALTHLANPAPQKNSRTDGQHPAEKVCIECIVFAQLGTALSAQPPAAPVLPADTLVVAATFRTFAPEFVPAFHSRAPPSRV